MFTADPEYIKAILATQFDDFIKGEAFITQMDSLLGTGVFNSDSKSPSLHPSTT